MKPKSSTIFSRIILLIAGLITALGAVFVVITYIVATNYYESSTQLLNKDVAGHIAEFTAPFNAQGLNKRKADSVFHDAMVLSPNSEVYFLDTTGAVIDYYEKSKQPSIRLWNVSLDIVRRHIAAGNQDYIKGPDPRDPAKPKIFSAAEVRRGDKKLGYIYVILASSEARQVASMLLSNHVIILSIVTFSCIIVLSLLLSFLYVRRIQRRFNRVVDVLERFQQGDYDARFKIHRQDGLGPIKSAFNTMADMLVYHINRLTKSEADRKAFITGITHDLRNPLSVAGGYAETLLIKGADGGLTTSQSQEYTQLILQKLRQVEHLVEQLHELSAMESPAFSPHREPFMFSEVLNEIAHNFQPGADAKSITIDCERCEDDAYINADISMMERVIQNLMANAVSYSPEKSSIVAELSREGAMLVFSVKNKSPLLPARFLNWLSSNSADTVMDSFPEKPAIGLTIVKRILQLHDYRLSVTQQQSELQFEIMMEIVKV